MLEHMLSELKHSVMLKKADYASKYAGIMGLCLTKGPQKAARARPRRERGRARASRGVSASVGVCAGVKEYEIVNLLKKKSAVWEREPCVCCGVSLGENPNYVRARDRRLS